MAKWNYDMSTAGKSLRDAIAADSQSIESCQLVLDRLLNCFDWIKEHCISKIVASFESYRPYVFETIDELKEMQDPHYVLETDDYEFAEEAVNQHLKDFYDLCDMYKIWVGI